MTGSAPREESRRRVTDVIASAKDRRFGPVAARRSASDRRTWQRCDALVTLVPTYERRTARPRFSGIATVSVRDKAVTNGGASGAGFSSSCAAPTGAGSPSGRSRGPQAHPGHPAARRTERGGGPAYAALDLDTNNCRILLPDPVPFGFRVFDAFSRIVRLRE